MTPKTRSANRLSLFTAGILLLSAWVCCPISQGFVVNGSVTDSGSNPLSNIRVAVWEAVEGEDVILGVTHTDASGNYSITITEGWTGEHPEVYTKASWRFRLLPEATHSHHHVVLLERRGVTPVVFTDKESARRIFTNPSDPNLSVDLAIQMDQSQDYIEDMRFHINQAVDYVHENTGTIGSQWNLDYDIKVLTYERGFGGMGFLAVEGQEHLELTLRPFTDPEFGIPTIYHEMAHYVMFKLYGNHLGGVNYGFHWPYSEAPPEFAFKEGWASYLALVMDEEYTQTGVYEKYKDKNGTHWRGDEGCELGTTPPPAVDCIPAPTGIDNGQFESGAYVEGAVSGVLYDVHDAQSFEKVFHVLASSPQPYDIDEFRSSYLSLYGSDPDAVYDIVDAMFKHGIPCFRGRFRLSPFSAPPPPNACSADEGNVHTSGDYTFVRGRVPTCVERLNTVDLGVLSVMDFGAFRIWAKAAQDGDLWCVEGAGSFTDPETPGKQISEVGTYGPDGTGQVALDTSEWADGDYDLIVQGMILDGEGGPVALDWWAPSWSGDADFNYATDERYLRQIGTWYDSDRSWLPPNEDGKIMVDNTAPVFIRLAP